MHYKTILTALVEELGGCGKGLEKELDRMFDECPNIAIICADFLRNGAMLAQEVSDLNTKCELLKDCLLQNKLLLRAPKLGSSEIGEPGEGERQVFEEALEAVNQLADAYVEQEEIRINDVVWHLACDEEKPN